MTDIMDANEQTKKPRLAHLGIFPEVYTAEFHEFSRSNSTNEQPHTQLKNNHEPEFDLSFSSNETEEAENTIIDLLWQKHPMVINAGNHVNTLMKESLNLNETLGHHHPNKKQIDFDEWSTPMMNTDSTDYKEMLQNIEAQTILPMYDGTADSFHSSTDVGQVDVSEEINLIKAEKRNNNKLTRDKRKSKNVKRLDMTEIRSKKRREFHKIHTRRSRAKLNEKMEMLRRVLPEPPSGLVVKSKAQVIDYAIRVLGHLSPGGDHDSTPQFSMRDVNFAEL